MKPPSPMAGKEESVERLTEAAFELCLRYHDGQYRSGLRKTPYAIHPIRVASLFGCEEAKQVALMHDLLEDTEMKVDELYDVGFSSNVIDAVLTLTKRKGEVYTEYLHRVAKDHLTLSIKVADIKDNLNDSPSPNQIEKYQRALHFFTQPPTDTKKGEK